MSQLPLLSPMALKKNNCIILPFMISVEEHSILLFWSSGKECFRLKQQTETLIWEEMILIKKSPIISSLNLRKSTELIFPKIDKPSRDLETLQKRRRSKYPHL